MPEFGQFTLTTGVVTSDHIEDGTIVNADINASAAIAYSKLATDPRIARIKTGQYTGDGTTSQAITGIGFQPKKVRIWRHYTADANGTIMYEKTDTFDSDMAFALVSTAFARDNRLISLDTDGFTVGDDGTDLDPNANGITYDYEAYG